MEYRVIVLDTDGCNFVFGAENYRKKTGFTGTCVWVDVDGDVAIDFPVGEDESIDYRIDGKPYYYGYYLYRIASPDIPDEIWAELLLMGAKI